MTNRTEALLSIAKSDDFFPSGEKERGEKNLIHFIEWELLPPPPVGKSAEEEEVDRSLLVLPCHAISSERREEFADFSS